MNALRILKAGNLAYSLTSKDMKLLETGACKEIHLVFTATSSGWYATVGDKETEKVPISSLTAKKPVSEKTAEEQLLDVKYTCQKYYNRFKTEPPALLIAAKSKKELDEQVEKLPFTTKIFLEMSNAKFRLSAPNGWATDKPAEFTAEDVTRVREEINAEKAAKRSARSERRGRGRGRGFRA